MPFLATILVTMLKEKIMVIDDDQDIIEVISILLNWKGFEVVTFTSPHNIVDEIKTHKPSLVILDVQMGAFDGRDVCKQIKEIKELALLPILLFSANSDYRHNIKSYLCDDFLDKPFDIKSLLDKINHYLQQYNAAIDLKAMAAVTA